MRALRRNQTPAENMLWQALRSKQVFGYKFRRQHAVGQFILDFYCSSLKVGIEIDGKVHVNPTAQEYDSARSNIIKEYGIILIRIKASAVENNLAHIIEKLKAIIKKLPSPRNVERGRGKGEAQ